VTGITDEMLSMAKETRSDVGSGGMSTKLQAARIATHAGCSTVIASGAIDRPVKALLAGARCTVFPAEGTPAAARKQWLAGALEVSGVIVIDAGAAAALRDGRSLLPVGITAVHGTFERGDIVTLANQQGSELGRGLVEYSSDDAARLLGCRSENIEERLGHRGRSVMVHRDELVLFAHDS